jgi:prepilin-type processing-associated H-X9-DG protein
LDSGPTIANNIGLFCAGSSTKLAGITDGTSNTIIFGERAHALLDEQDARLWFWWASSSFGDTQFNTMWPLNPHHKIANFSGTIIGLQVDIFVSSASSLHPGGANFGFVDGSVRFLKDTIQSWPLDPATGIPIGLTQQGGYWNTKYYLRGTRFGVYQALSTRNGGEVISSDSNDIKGSQISARQCVANSE